MSKGNKYRSYRIKKVPKLRIPISTRPPKIEAPKNVYKRKKFVFFPDNNREVEEKVSHK